MESVKQRIPFGQRNPQKSHAVFLAIYSRHISPWKYFNDDLHVKECSGVIMIDRWDGRTGFPGGTADEKETLLEALEREIKEEIGIQIRPNKIHGIASHEWKIGTHFFGMEVNEMELMHIFYHILNNFARSTLLHAYQEGDRSRFLSETTGIKLVPIVSHKGKGVDHFLTNAFAGSADLDFRIFLEEILEFHIA
ncbi:NUDIX hydrolase [Sulfurospirillum sp. T05]|uniref:U8 snoRNA-decapping enzyme n=1 Tax=Sulfurospirillum tamanense TaxID=2813362 RepID=A0ABS2WQH8_9BACT|nr:NUDIX hydrolase [Sulfurospirillum tamanensis]MBN2963474.1 NUDIX hydrolase [Sulfurospirillum tamanensis]